MTKRGIKESNIHSTRQCKLKPHIDHNDDVFLQTTTQDAHDICLMNQPANSPYLNVLDLGFFSAIQSLQYKKSPKSVDELVDVVVKSSNAFLKMKSDHTFLTLQLCMIEIKRARGSHKYKIPHIDKAMLKCESNLPTLKCLFAL